MPGVVSGTMLWLGDAYTGAYDGAVAFSGDLQGWCCFLGFAGFPLSLSGVV